MKVWLYSFLTLCWLLTTVSIAQEEAGTEFDIETALEILEPENGQNITELQRFSIVEFDELLEELGLDSPNFEEMPPRFASDPYANCHAHEYSFPGQGRPPTIKLLDGLARKPDNNNIVDFGFVRSSHPISTLAANMERSVGIIVLDTFVLEDNESGQKSYELSREVTGISLPAHMSDDDIRSQRVVVEGKFTHGALVLNHLNALIEATGEFQVSGESQWDDAYTVTWIHSRSKQALKIVAVDMGTDTASAKDALSSALDGMIDEGITQVTVNMSFGIIPCLTASIFEANKEKFSTFEDYLVFLSTALVADRILNQPEAEAFRQSLRDWLELNTNDRRSLAELLSPSRDEYNNLREEAVAVMTNPLRTLSDEEEVIECLVPGVGGEKYLIADPLLGFLCNLDTKTTLSLVAASGNFALNYQTFPAALSEVVGVSASEMNTQNPIAEFSNDGQILELGAYFRLQNWHDLGNSSQNMTFAGWHYSGTSFAAPAVSLFTALDMANMSPNCSKAGERKPGLIYKFQQNSNNLEPKHPDPLRPNYPALKNELLASAANMCFK